MITQMGTLSDRLFGYSGQGTALIGAPNPREGRRNYIMVGIVTVLCKR